MTSLALKSYQQSALDVLATYARSARQHFVQLVLQHGSEGAWLVEPDWAHQQVKHWVRNLDTAPCGFGLPTSRGRFYADFVAEMVDGRVALLEYKGAHLLNDPYEIEKSQIGALWAQASGGRAVFGWLSKQQGGKSLAQQLDAVLA
jgi:type III restriction enzyme